MKSHQCPEYSFPSVLELRYHHMQELWVHGSPTGKCLRISWRLVIATLQAPTSEVQIQEARDGAQKSALLTSSQVILLLSDGNPTLKTTSLDFIFMHLRETGLQDSPPWKSKKPVLQSGYSSPFLGATHLDSCPGTIRDVHSPWSLNSSVSHQGDPLGWLILVVKLTGLRDSQKLVEHISGCICEGVSRKDWHVGQ